jgi:hypothetical protein
MSRHSQGTNNSSLVGAATAGAPTRWPSNAAVLLSAPQQRGVNSPSTIDRLPQQIAMNMDQIQRLMNKTNANAAVASPLDRQEIMLPQMTGIGSIRHNTKDHGTSQQRQMLYSPRVSQYARLQQRQQDAVAAAATKARLRSEQEQRAAAVAAIVAAQSNHQQQYRMNQLQLDLQTLERHSFRRRICNTKVPCDCSKCIIIMMHPLGASIT